MKLQKTLLALTLLLPAAFAQAHDYQAGHLHIDHPWSREMPPVAPTSAAYFVIHNDGAEADRLLSASTPLAGKAELHQHLHVDGVMKMQQVPEVVIPAGGEVTFGPMGYHVMLFDLERQARDGERFPMTLNFEKAGTLQVEVQVQKDAPGDHAHGHGAAHGTGHAAH